MEIQRSGTLMWGDEHREHPEIPAILVLLEGLSVEETSLSIMGLSVATMTELSASPELDPPDLIRTGHRLLPRRKRCMPGSAHQQP